MQDHLEGCQECQKALRTWQSIRALARSEAAYEPPPNVVKSVKSAFSLYGPRKRRNRVAELAEIVFDSLRQPLPLGVRSVEVAGRKLLYQRGSLQIDLSVEPLAGTERLSIDGQVLDSNTPSKAIADIEVLALRGRRKLALTRTNTFGEFHLECQAGKDLQLAVWVTGQRELLLPLDQLHRKTSRAQP